MNKNKLKNKAKDLNEILRSCLQHIKTATDSEIIGIMNAIQAITKGKKVIGSANTKKYERNK